MALSFVLAPVLPIASAFLIIDGLHHLNGSQTWLQTGINNFKEWLIDKLRPDMATQEQNEQIPTIQGGKNQSGANQPIPLVLGETYYTPLYIGTPYSTIDTSKHNNGETEYFTALYCLGQSDIEVRDFELGIYTIASNESNITSGVIPIDESSVYPQSSYDTQLEIQNGNTEVSLYNQKVVQESLNAQLLNVDGQERLVVRTFSARYPQKVRLEVQFQSLVKYSDDDGEKEDDSVEIGFAYSIDNVNNDGTFNALHQMGDWGNNNDVAITFEGDHVYKNTTYAVYKFTAKQNKQMRFALDFNLSWEQACTSVAFGGSVVEFAICRFNVENTNTNYQDKCYFTRITTWCYDYKKSTETSSFVAQSPLVERFRNLTTRVGFKIKAGDELNGTLNAFNCIVKAKGRTYDPSTETWSNNTVVTSNPASMALMCMQSQLRGKYTYEDSKLDLYSFGQLYTRCEQIDSELNAPRYTVNGVVNTQKKTSELIQSILNCANSYLVLKGTKYGIFVDEPQYNPVMVLNNQNVLEANNSKSFDETTHAIKVKFVNAINYYKQDTMLCVANNYLNMDESDMNILETEFLYYTNPKRVYRKAMRLLAEKKLRPEVWNRKVGIEGNLIEIGNLVELQDDTISVGIGNGAEITEVITDSSNNIIGIHTDGEFDVVDSVGKSYAVKITQADGVHKPTVQTFVININGDDTYSNFTFATPISASAYIKPCVGDIVTFGIFTKESVQALCFGKKDNGDGTFNLTFVPYDEGVYESESGDIPEFNSNVTPPKQNGVAIDENEQNKYLEIILKNKEKGLDGYTLYSEGTSIVLNATSDGTIEETVFPCKINFMQGTDNVYFEFGNIVLPNGVSYYIDNTTVNLIFAQGNSLLDKGVIEIPIRYSKLEDNVLFVTPNGDTFGYGGTQFGYHILDPNKSEFIVKVSYAKSKQGESINIVSSTNYYQVSTSRSNVPTGTWSTSIPSMSDNQYLWTKTVV